MSKYGLIFIAFFLAIHAMAQSSGEKVLHRGWTFSEYGNAEKYKAQVPGTIHTDLMGHH